IEVAPWPKRRETTFTSSGWEARSAILQLGNLLICILVNLSMIRALQNYKRPDYQITNLLTSSVPQEPYPASRLSAFHENRSSPAPPEPSCRRQCIPLLPA